MSLQYLNNNVFDEALNRIRWLYDNYDDVVVSMSGGKDSTVCYELTKIVASEKHRLPVKVFWLDQEAEWQSTVDYMQEIMEDNDTIPLWYQIPFDFTNSLSAKTNFIHLWDPSKSAEWIHEQHPLSIKNNLTKYNRSHDLVNCLPDVFPNKGEKTCIIVGMRIVESLNRRSCILYSKGKVNGITWCKQRKGSSVFWPVYDMTNDDIWTAIGKNHWKYNKIYDFLYQAGCPKSAMRVSALIHETSWHAIEYLQEFEPDTYNKFIRRVNGVSTFNHEFDNDSIVPKKLPFAFKDWKGYRDYLLLHIVQPQYWDLFRKRWANQNDDYWYKVHVHEIIINDIDGTINANAKSNYNLKNKRQSGEYYQRCKVQFNEWRKEKNND